MANNDTTHYLYELAWILPSVALPVGMLAALLVTAFGAHIHLPGQAATIDPARIDSTPPFDQPGIVETGPGRYEARIIGGIWFFNPPVIRVPEGSEVTFVATSRDVIHGLFLPEADVNVMLIPATSPASPPAFRKPASTPSSATNTAASPTIPWPARSSSNPWNRGRAAHGN